MRVVRLPKLKLSPLRLHQVMYTMIYPAVLGSFLYTYWDKVANEKFDLANPTPWLGGALFIAVFTLDYAYSLAKEIQDNYKSAEFLADVLIVVLIYVAAQSLFGTPIEKLKNVPTYWVYLFLLKFASMAWELSRLRAAREKNLSSKPRRPFPVVFAETDMAMVVLAVILGVVAFFLPPAWQVVPLAAFLLVDGVLYVAYTSDA